MTDRLKPEGFFRVFDFHNHPSGTSFFSDSDYRDLMVTWSGLVGQVAVSRNGYCIALKTNLTNAAVKKFGQENKLSPELAMEDLWDRTIRTTPDFKTAVKIFNIDFCRKIGLRLIFVPVDSDKMEVLV